MQGTESIKTILTCDRSTCFCRGSVASKRNAFPVPSKAHFAPSYHIELADRTMSWARSEEPAPLFHSLDSWGRWDLFSGGMKVARSPQTAWSIELLRVATGNYGGARSDWRQVQSLMYYVGVSFPSWDGGECMYHDMLHGFESSRAHDSFK